MGHPKRVALAVILLLLAMISILGLMPAIDAGRPVPSSVQEENILSKPVLEPANPQELTAQRKVSDRNQAMSMSSANAATPLTGQSVTVMQSTSKALLLKQRDDLYKHFEEISTGLSHGQQPDLGQVSALLAQQRQLVKMGILSTADAITYSEFLRQILPAMDREINQHIEQLKP